MMTTSEYIYKSEFRFTNPIRCDLFEYVKTDFAKGYGTITKSTLYLFGFFGPTKNTARDNLKAKFKYFKFILTSIYGGYIEIKTTEPLDQNELNLFSDGMQKYFNTYFPDTKYEYNVKKTILTTIRI